MPTAVRKRLARSRAPVKITRVGTPNLSPAKPAVKAPAKPVSRAKSLFSTFADHLAAIAGLIKGIRDKEREGKISAGTANKLAAQLSEFMILAEELSAAEAKARLNAIQEEATKATTRIVHVTPAVSPVAVHTLAQSLGVRRTAEQCDAEARRMTREARERASFDHLPEGARPVIMDRPNPQVVEYIPGGSRLPTPLVDQAAVYMAIVELFQAADNRPIVLLVSELSAMTGLNHEAVNTAITELEKRRLITRQPGRVGSVQLWAPSSLVNVARD